MSIDDETERLIERAERSIRNRLNNMIRRAVLTIIDDQKKQQELNLDVLKGEPQDEIENFEHYGLTTRAPKGTEFILIRPGGAGENQIAIASAFRERRPKLDDEDDVTIWDRSGQKIELKRSKIVITCQRGNTIELVVTGTSGTKSVARLDDIVAGDEAFDLWVTQVQAALNALAPGSVTPTISSMSGSITSGSSVVKASS